MRENKFENKVREKMDQLGFDPSDAVWARVDREINRGKKKRRPLFWIFICAGLVLGGGGLFLTIQNKSSDRMRAPTPAYLTNKASDSIQTIRTQAEKIIPSDRMAQKAGSKANLTTASENTGVLPSAGKQNLESRSLAMNNQNGLNPATGPLGEKTDETTIKGYTQVPSGKISNDQPPPRKDSPIVAGVKEQKTNKKLPEDSGSVKKTASAKKLQTKSSPWSVGITGTGGISNINESLFHSLNADNNSYAAYAPSNSAGGPLPTGYASSDIQSGFSFGLGVFVNRHFSRRVSLSAGIGYHYYSTRMHTGNNVDSVMYVYMANAAYAQPGLAAVNTFYRNGVSHQYTNQFHFVELPVNLNLQMNKSSRNPLNWEAGFSLAWLLNTNALQFDSYNNVYFENSQLFNKIQWNVTTAVLFGFPVREHTIQLGPQVQYGLSGLLKTNTANPGHLSYLGIKISFIP